MTAEIFFIVLMLLLTAPFIIVLLTWVWKVCIDIVESIWGKRGGMIVDRKELAQEMFVLLKQDPTLLLSEKEAWEAIACTDDASLLTEYEERKSNRWEQNL